MPKPSDLVRWPNYDTSRHTDVLIEEFSGQIGIDDLKHWVDPWPFKARTYGGEQEIRPVRFWLTSNHPPSQWWGGRLKEEDVDALKLRTTASVKCFAWSELPIAHPDRFKDTNSFFEEFKAGHVATCDAGPLAGCIPVTDVPAGIL